MAAFFSGLSNAREDAGSPDPDLALKVFRAQPQGIHKTGEK